MEPGCCNALGVSSMWLNAKELLNYFSITIPRPTTWMDYFAMRFKTNTTQA
jgi:hypothetical protein